MLLFAGVVIGCLNAWYWVNREQPGAHRGASSDDHGDVGGADVPPDTETRSDE